jgi:1,4-dihydroxy-2-naphthoyl-CoA synthase
MIDQSGERNGDPGCVDRFIPTTVVRVERIEGIATIIMDDPARRNALTSVMCQQLCHALQQADGDPLVSLVIVKGNGPSFCAGGDIKAMRAKSDFFAGDSFDIMESYRRTVQQIPLTLVSMKKPTVAVINGSAVGAGLISLAFVTSESHRVLQSLPSHLVHLGSFQESAEHMPYLNCLVSAMVYRLIWH